MDGRKISLCLVGVSFETLVLKFFQISQTSAIGIKSQDTLVSKVYVGKGYFAPEKELIGTSVNKRDKSVPMETNENLLPTKRRLWTSFNQSPENQTYRMYYRAAGRNETINWKTYRSGKIWTHSVCCK